MKAKTPEILRTNAICEISVILEGFLYRKAVDEMPIYLSSPTSFSSVN